MTMASPFAAVRPPAIRPAITDDAFEMIDELVGASE
jgi:hypothetical protein